MNIKKILKKLAQIADFQQTPEVTEPAVQPVGQPSTAQPGQVDTGVAQTGPLAPVQESPSIIQTTVAEWHPSRGRNKGKTYYYLQLMNVPAGPGEEILTRLGYKYNAKFGSWSKQAKEDNVLKINSELDTIEQKLGVSVARDAIAELQKIFGFTSETSTEMGGSTAEDVKKIKFVEEGQQQEIAESLLKSKLEEMVDNLGSEETKAFLDEYLSVKKATSGKVHPYSFLNSMLISWQNREIDPETGEMARRSGFIAPASLREKK